MKKCNSKIRLGSYLVFLVNSLCKILSEIIVYKKLHYYAKSGEVQGDYPHDYIIMFVLLGRGQRSHGGSWKRILHYRRVSPTT